ncbi:hypothetical protein ES703_15930 [subsurface metagenome]
MSLAKKINISANIQHKRTFSLRIFFAVNIPFPEGQANTRRIRSIARELVNQGYQAKILIPFSRKPQASVQVIEGIIVEWCLIPPTEQAFFNAKKRVKLSVQFISRCLWLREFWRKSKRKEYDWLYLYQPGIDGLIAAIIARHFQRRICSEYVDLLSPSGYRGFIWRIIYCFQVLADRKVAFFSDIIFTISSLLQDIYQRRNPHSPVLMFPTLVDTSRFGIGDWYRFRRDLNLKERPVVTFTGSFTRPQGLRILIEAMVGVAKKFPDIMLLIAGGSLAFDADDACKLINQHGLEKNSIYLGTIPETDIIDLLAASDILVMPKLDDPINHAGLSTKLAEYLASGKAVIASNVGDVGKYLVNEQHALVVPPGNRDALEMAVLRLLRDRRLCNFLGANGRKIAIQNFDVKVNVEKLVEALRSHN